MSTVKVNVKWGKKKYEKIEVDLAEPPAVFKSQLFSLTGVPPERQRLMIGGLILGDEEWSNTKSKVKNNATFMMMGSADSLPEAPKQKTKFLEDMTDTEAAAALSLPTGIENFGNTCYLNATLQCLKVVPELRSALGSYHVPATRAELMDTDTASPQSLTRDLKMLYLMMESGQDIRIPSMLFLHTLHAVKPEFAHKDEKTGSYKQQDAHECWSAMVNNLSETLRVPGIPPPPSTNQGATGGRNAFIKQYFGVETKSTYKCEECPDEPVTTETETSYQVSCFIAQDVKYMYTAMRKGMEGTVKKKSAVLGRDAEFKKTSPLSRLPGYLTVQFVRFSVGKAPDSGEPVARKILKDVKYTMKLDMYEFCTTELQQKLSPMRTKFKEQEEKKMAQKAKLIAEGKLLGPKLAGAAAIAR
ncbi:Ubiquitin carboxyl-terminal hydrolase 14 [Geodia barretti]|uniref:Ubiquitin carboxyl-terminal hydrolase 14 n=1 Tax=Geodia barretti TaxID=519541 RepID=A0AA35TBR9_GEOBA|nr:Ubiquitin carboxyl-terminal hydrolase 14 [Geodia barretti]